MMDYQKIPFPDAVQVLAERYNIPIMIEKGEGTSELFTSLYQLHEIAVKLYQKNLFSEDGQKALEYLKARNLKEDIIKQFKIGLAFNAWDQLVKQCKNKGFTQTQIIKSGLFTRSDKGIFDRFRSRIMFPIFHPSGKPIAFGGRIHNSDDPAKYLNSPETPLYKKSNVFYGLQATRDSIRKEGFVILVEGYMDFLKLYQASIHPVVSVSGTAFTLKHASSLSRMTQKVILLYDGDEAGGTATERAGWVLLRSGLIPSVVRPPKGTDPDDWVSNVGSKAVMSNIKEPLDYIDFHIDFHQGADLSGPERQKYIISLAGEIKNIDDGVIRNDLIKAISEKLNVNEKDLIRIVNTQRVNPEYRANTNTDLDERITFNNQVEKAQIELLKLLANNNNEIRQYVLEHVTIGLFKAPLLKKLADILFDKNLNVESSAIIEYFQDKNERDSVAQILFAEYENISFEEIVSDCLKILKSEPLKEKIYSLRGQIREKESKGENILEELSAITKLREELNGL
tara:strand:+ start:118 stop:1650 length:1533 start_codon:yes stop_codon:yes gene_type:complete